MTQTPDRPRYHHGALRDALLAAAEEELVAVGTERFSLRSVAKRAGVSHAAPAHHFGDVQGLLTALCASGFHRFLASQAAREALAPPDDPRAQLIAAGLGYVDFAMAHPALFRLMFASDKPARESMDLAMAGYAAFAHLQAQVMAAGGASPTQLLATGPMTADLAAAWAMAHGLADLIGQGPMMAVAAMAPADRDALLIQILSRSLPTSSHAPTA
jgi:AcrR family transcriptional regulator